MFTRGIFSNKEFKLGMLTRGIFSNLGGLKFGIFIN